MVKCKLCGNKIEELFLGKIKGTIIKGEHVCADCQKKHKDKLAEQL